MELCDLLCYPDLLINTYPRVETYGKKMRKGMGSEQRTRRQDEVQTETEIYRNAQAK
jgi:hypothetical protein